MGRGVPLDGGVVGDDHAEAARNEAHAGDDAARVDFLLAVEFVAGEGRELEEGRSGVEQFLDAFADEQLARLVHLVEHLFVALEGGLPQDGREGGVGLVHELLVA